MRPTLKPGWGLGYAEARFTATSGLFPVLLPSAGVTENWDPRQQVWLWKGSRSNQSFAFGHWIYTQLLERFQCLVSGFRKLWQAVCRDRTDALQSWKQKPEIRKSHYTAVGIVISSVSLNREKVESYTERISCWSIKPSHTATDPAEDSSAVCTNEWWMNDWLSDWCFGDLKSFNNLLRDKPFHFQRPCISQAL